MDSRLSLRLVLRPFIPIHAIGKVVRASQRKGNPDEGFETAVEFVEIAEEDREAIIRHVIRAQALIQRHRSSQSHPWVAG